MLRCEACAGCIGARGVHARFAHAARAAPTKGSVEQIANLSLVLFDRAARSSAPVFSMTRAHQFIRTWLFLPRFWGVEKKVHLSSTDIIMREQFVTQFYIRELFRLHLYSRVVFVAYFSSTTSFSPPGYIPWENFRIMSCSKCCSPWFTGSRCLAWYEFSSVWFCRPFWQILQTKRKKWDNILIPSLSNEIDNPNPIHLKCDIFWVSKSITADGVSRS